MVNYLVSSCPFLEIPNRAQKRLGHPGEGPSWKKTPQSQVFTRIYPQRSQRGFSRKGEEKDRWWPSLINHPPLNRVRLLSTSQIVMSLIIGRSLRLLQNHDICIIFIQYDRLWDMLHSVLSREISLRAPNVAWSPFSRERLRVSLILTWTMSWLDHID